MPNIPITIKDKIAVATEPTPIVCGNEDYTVIFDFDDEWDDFTDKIARFAFVLDGAIRHVDVNFSGNQVTVPALYNIDQTWIGVMAEDSKCTTTPAQVKCKRSAFCSTVEQWIPPGAELQEQLKALFSGEALDGLQLSHNDFTDADKALVGALLVEDDGGCSYTARLKLIGGKPVIEYEETE